MKKIVRGLLVSSILLSTSVFGAYPSKSISIVVPSKAGGSTDTTARLFVESAKKYWKDASWQIWLKKEKRKN